MRLINAATLQLARFDDDTEIPPYTILSHTWGAEEVSLQHFENAYTGDEITRTRVRQMLGYVKIVKACHQTLDDNYAYVWVDTCTALPRGLGSQLLTEIHQAASTRRLLLNLVRQSTACSDGIRILKSVTLT
jgi:hypothetical protein